jgi:hypothetical protein
MRGFHPVCTSAEMGGRLCREAAADDGEDRGGLAFQKVEGLLQPRKKNNLVLPEFLLMAIS